MTPNWQSNSSSLASPLPARTRRKSSDSGVLERLVATLISPRLAAQKRLADDLLWLGLLLGMLGLWCTSADLHAGLGINPFSVALVALSTLLLVGGFSLGRSAFRRGWRPPRS